MEIKQEAVKQTESFVARKFKKHPNFSFNDWTVMRNHSLRVRDLALQISEGMDVDKTVVAIGALLHDIGKTYEADSKTLHAKHEGFNLPVSKRLLQSLDLLNEQLRKLEEILQHKSDSIEMKVIEDADILAFYSDKKLYMLFQNWAHENKLEAGIQKKIDKFSKLNFPLSKELGKEWLETMKRDWDVK